MSLCTFVRNLVPLLLANFTSIFTPSWNTRLWNVCSVNWLTLALSLVQFSIYLSKWHMMQMFCACLRYDGSGSSRLTLRNIAFQTAVYFICHLKVTELEGYKCYFYYSSRNSKEPCSVVIFQMPCILLQIGESLKHFSLDVTCTGKPRNGGKETRSFTSY